MLSAYLDETGHAKDEQQKFAGMGGLVAPAAFWETFEAKWQKALADFNIPYFHMREFAHTTGIFSGWAGNEPKRQKLFGKLMRILETTYPIPIGSIVSLADYRRLSPARQNYFGDPYNLTLGNCISTLLTMAFKREMVYRARSGESRRTTSG